MENKAFWILFTKNKPMEKCKIRFDDSEYYTVEVCVPVAESKGLQQLDAIINQAKQRLLESQVELSDVSKCIRYIAKEWQEQTELNDEIRELVNATQASGKVEVGCFRSEEVEEECKYRHIAYGCEDE